MEAKSDYTGFIVRDRILGKKLRFVDLFPAGALELTPEKHLDGANDGINPGVLATAKQGDCSPIDLVHLVFVNNETFDSSSTLFPDTMKALRSGDKISVKISHREPKKIKVNMGKRPNCDNLNESLRKTDHTRFNYFVKSWKLLERPRNGGDVVKYLREIRAGTDHILCKTWIFKGHCPNKTCPYRHGVLNEHEERRVKARIMQQKHDKAVGAIAVARYREKDRNVIHTVQENESGHGVRHDQDKKMRSKLFARWLLEIFGKETLEGGSGVLDVAGGKGHVSMQLLYQTKSPTMRTTVIDPVRRKTLISKRYKKALKKLSLNPPDFVHVYFDNQFLQHPEYRQLLKDSSVIVGMHPDEATGSIVEIALEEKKPFAILPCCVFANKFPERKTPSGKRVETLNELIDWLKLKTQSSGNIQTALLPMEGRNKILYMRQQDYFV